MIYNPEGKELWKSKSATRIGYKKGTFITDVDKIADIIKNGGQVEVKAQEVRDLKGVEVQVIECKIYFISQ